MQIRHTLLMSILAVLTPKLCAQPKLMGTPVLSTIAEADCPAVPPPPTSRFLSSDPNVTLWFKVEGLQPGGTIEFLFTDPKGISHAAGSGMPTNPAAGMICYGTPTSALGKVGFGRWSVTAYLKSEPTPLFPPVPFTLENAPPDAGKMRLLNDAFNSGLKAEGTGDWSAALAAFRRASALDPGQFAGWGHLADAARNLARQTSDRGLRSELRKEALGAYEQAIRLRPNDAGIHFNYAIALSENGDLAGARARLDLAVRLDPSHAGQYYYNMGASAAGSGRGEEACEWFRAAVRAQLNYGAAQQQVSTYCSQKSGAGSQEPE